MDVPIMSDKARTANKSRILFLLQYFQANTDDEHVIATNDLMGEYIRQGDRAWQEAIMGRLSFVCSLFAAWMGISALLLSISYAAVHMEKVAEPDYPCYGQSPR